MNSREPIAGLILLLAGTLVSGCGQTPVVPDGGEPTAPDTVLVVFRNLSLTDAVQVNFYASSDPVTNLPDDLFVPANLNTTGVGVAGTGIVQPAQFDFVRDFPCTDDLVIGTSGGQFVDNDSGEVRGTSPPRWLEAAAAGFCGGAVTFTFSNSDGEFETTVAITH